MASSFSSSFQENSLADSCPLMQLDRIKESLDSALVKGKGEYYKCRNQINERIAALSKNALITPELKIILREFCANFDSTDFKTLSKRLESIRRLFSFILPQCQDLPQEIRNLIGIYLQGIDRKNFQIETGALNLKIVEEEVFSLFAAAEPFSEYDSDHLKTFEQLLDRLGMSKRDLLNLETDYNLSFEDIVNSGGLENALICLTKFIKNFSILADMDIADMDTTDENFFTRLKLTILEIDRISPDTNNITPNLTSLKLSGKGTLIPTDVSHCSYPSFNQSSTGQVTFNFFVERSS